MTMPRALQLFFAWLAGLSGFVAGAAIVGLILLAMDRDPPYKLLSVEPATCYPGGEVRFHSKVWRDPSRDCAGDVTRSMTDASGTTRFVGYATFADDDVDRMERECPGCADSSIVCPSQSAIGPAVMRSTLRYRCNITQWVKPIEVVVERPFTVTPRP